MYASGPKGMADAWLDSSQASPRGLMTDGHPYTTVFPNSADTTLLRLDSSFTQTGDTPLG